MLRIDAHQHFWDLGRFEYSWLNAAALKPIRRSFLPDDLQPWLRQAGMDWTVCVQTQHNLDENRWALDLAGQYDFIAGVVGWVDLAHADCERQVEELAAEPRFVGVRHVTQDEPDDDFIVRDDVLAGLSVLERYRVPFDLLFYPWHLRHVPTLARRLPELPMVIDHLAKPEISRRRMDNWREPFQQAGRFPNVFCKLSGLITEAVWQHWQPDDLRPYVEVALEAFGPERCMFGSDWPVCQLAGDYQQVHDALASCLEPLSATEQVAIWGGTAASFYRLAQRNSPP